MLKTKTELLKIFCQRRPVQIFALRLSALCLIFLLFAVYNSAQATRKNLRPKIKTEKSKPAIPKPNNAVQKDEVREANNPVKLVNQVEADYLTGEASITVSPRQPAVVRLGLAQNATSVVEFPAVDQIYYIHEGNPKLVTVFGSPTKETDRSITLYPGEGFLPAPTGQKELSVTVTMQMKSGLVIVLEIVPAPDIRQNAHRCVLNYNLSEVIAARRAAGLKVNLGDEAEIEQKTQTRAVSTLLGNNPVTNTDLRDVNTASSQISAAQITSGDAALTAAVKRKMKSGAELSRLVNKKLAEAVKSSKEKFTVWSPPVEGLSLSTAKVIEIDDAQRLLIIAIKNVTVDSLRLLDEMPELRIQTVDKMGNSLQIERLNRKYTETTALQGAIRPGETVYYAIVYENPVLGANQKLLVSAAHDRAADVPAITAAVNQKTKTEEE